MKMLKENVSRKIDTLGRISIPKSLRDRLEIKEGDMVDFYFLEDEDEYYVCFNKHVEGAEMADKYLKIAKLMKEVGLDIPEEVSKWL